MVPDVATLALASWDTDDQTPRISGEVVAVRVSREAGFRLDLRDYYIGRPLLIATVASIALWAGSLLGIAFSVPQLWAFLIPPAIGATLLLGVISFDYATSDRSGRPATFRKLSHR